MKNVTKFLCPRCGWPYSPEFGYLTPQHIHPSTKKAVADPTVKNPPFAICPGSGKVAVVEGPMYGSN